MSGMRNRICRKKVITMEGIGLAMDWKKVVTSMTKPRIGVIQKLARSPGTPMASISSVAPKAARMASGNTMIRIQMMQVMPTEKAEA